MDNKANPKYTEVQRRQCSQKKKQRTEHMVEQVQKMKMKQLGSHLRK